MIIQIIIEHLLCWEHYQALGVETDSGYLHPVPDIDAYSLNQGSANSPCKGPHSHVINIFSFAGHPASVVP